MKIYEYLGSKKGTEKIHLCLSASSVIKILLFNMNYSLSQVISVHFQNVAKWLFLKH